MCWLPPRPAKEQLLPAKQRVRQRVWRPGWPLDWRLRPRTAQRLRLSALQALWSRAQPAPRSVGLLLRRKPRGITSRPQKARTGARTRAGLHAWSKIPPWEGVVCLAGQRVPRGPNIRRRYRVDKGSRDVVKQFALATLHCTVRRWALD